MGKMKEFAQDLAEAMGFENINATVLRIGQDILDTKNLPMTKRGIQTAKIASGIREQRFIRVCGECRAWWDGEDWTNRPIPQGQRTHGLCPECYEAEIREIRSGK